MRCSLKKQALQRLSAFLSLLSIATVQSSPLELMGEELRRFPAREANQGVTVNNNYFYAVDNSAIGKYDKSTGEKLATWENPNGPIQHLNSCTINNEQLWCANSNYPNLPMASSIEVFDNQSLDHVATRSLGIVQGSLTWAEQHENAWWLTFANYGGRGGDPRQDWRWTTLIQYDNDWQRQQGWIFPDDILELLAPKSSSGGTWGNDGLLYVTGHDRPEIYVLTLPTAGPILRHLATIQISTQGQAIDFDPEDPRLLYSINRRDKEVVVTRIPRIPQ